MSIPTEILSEAAGFFQRRNIGYRIDESGLRLSTVFSSPEGPEMVVDFSDPASARARGFACVLQTTPCADRLSFTVTLPDPLPPQALCDVAELCMRSFAGSQVSVRFNPVDRRVFIRCDALSLADGLSDQVLELLIVPSCLAAAAFDRVLRSVVFEGESVQAAGDALRRLPLQGSVITPS